MHDRFVNALQQRAGKRLLRGLASNRGIDFTSNDFLGLSAAPEIRHAVQKALKDGLPVGSGGSRLLRGNHPVHQKLEEQAAEFFGSEKSLYFANGYTANFALLTTLPARHDLIIYDSLVHASIREGLFKGACRSVRFPHNDADAVQRIVSDWRKSNAPPKQAWIVVESLYSMDGDCAPLDRLYEISKMFDCILIVDEAHATGVWGKNGRGFTEPFTGSDNLIVLHTCGKALGSSGGIVCGPGVFINYLVNYSRPFIYSTAPSPLSAVSVMAAIDLISSDSSRCLELHKRIRTANDQLHQRFGRKGSGTQIIPFILNDAGKTLHAARKMQEFGFDIRAIRPPTVPEGTSRLRISITLHAALNSITEMFDSLELVVQENGRSTAPK